MPCFCSVEKAGEPGQKASAPYLFSFSFLRVKKFFLLKYGFPFLFLSLHGLSPVGGFPSLSRASVRPARRVRLCESHQPRPCVGEGGRCNSTRRTLWTANCVRHRFSSDSLTVCLKITNLSKPTVKELPTVSPLKALWLNDLGICVLFHKSTKT